MARVVGLIPARAGSKSIPGKNFRLLGRWPLLAWVVAAAKQSPALHSIYISTDDVTAAETALSLPPLWLADSPVVILERPSVLAQDDTPDLPVFEDFLGRVRLVGSDVVVHLRPTAPLMRPSDIRDVVALLQAFPYASAVRSVVRPVHHPRKMYRIGPTPFAGPVFLQPYTADHAANAPRQILEPVWAAAGYVDAIRVRTILSGSMEGDHLLGWEAPRERAIDLDTEEDWVVAERLIATHGWAPGG